MQTASVFPCLIFLYIIVIFPFFSTSFVRCPLCLETACENEICSEDNLSTSCGCCPICTENKKILGKSEELGLFFK